MNWVLILFLGCVSPTQVQQPVIPVLDLEGVTRHIPAHVKDRQAWAEDVITAIQASKREPTAERVCSVLAIIEQESGYETDPIVPNLPHIIRQGLEKKLAPLGSLAAPALNLLLLGKAPGNQLSFGQRIEKLRTERDLDRFFRDIAETYHQSFPGPFFMASAMTMILGKGGLEQLNPVTTAGSMQVKVSFARQLKNTQGLTDAEIREELYTRAGGIRYGTARLLDYPASYADIIYRFSDYNAGIYASRNAAFQEMLAELTGQELVLDGDLLAYTDDGEPKAAESKSLEALRAFGEAHKISSWTISRDAKKEKASDFEATTSWRELRSAWETRTGRPAPYARIPNVKLSSPKLSQLRSTAWFASSVKRRYQNCRARD